MGYSPGKAEKAGMYSSAAGAAVTNVQGAYQTSLPVTGGGLGRGLCGQWPWKSPV